MPEEMSMSALMRTHACYMSIKYKYFMRVLRARVHVDSYRAPDTRVGLQRSPGSASPTG